MREPVLVCRDLHKSFGPRVAVDGVGFTVEPGECYGLLGPNGAGKTTTVSIVCGLTRADAGEVLVAGRVINVKSTDAKAAIGYVPQDVALYGDLTARENLRFFGRLYGMAGQKLHNRADTVLEVAGLIDRADDKVDTYSGGMKRRLNIAVGLLHKPSLIVLDEPTVGVDPQSRNAILESVGEMQTQGMAVLYTTHYMEEAERLCDRVGIIDDGRIIAEGTRRDLVEKVGQRDRIDIMLAHASKKFATACAKIDGVDEVTVIDGGMQLLAQQARLLLAQVFETAERCKAVITSVEIVEPDLEAVFLHLTGKALRD